MLTDRIGCGLVIINNNGHVEIYNSAAERLITSISEAKLGENLDFRELLKTVLTSDSDRIRLNSESWIVIPRNDKRPLTIHAIPAGDDSDPYNKTMIVITDLEENRSPKLEALQKLFKLSLSEAHIAIQISHGKAPSEIAQERGITLWTVRTQLTAIYSKTKTSRQAELVALMHKVALLSQ